MIVVDSTVIVAWGVEVPWSGEAARLLEEEETLIAPQAALTRAWEALRALQAAGHITRDTFQQLSLLLPAALAGIAADQQLLPAAADLAAEFDLASEPAMCLALAQARKARLATADPVLVDKASTILSSDRIIRIAWGTAETKTGREDVDNENGAEATEPEKKESLAG